VSVLPSHKNLLTQWFEEQIIPLYGHSRELRASSIQRKIGALRESVISALEIQLDRSKKPTSDTGGQVRGVEDRLRRATGVIEEKRSAWEKEIEVFPNDLSEAFYAMAASLVQGWSERPAEVILTNKVIDASILEFAQRRVKKLQDSLEALALQLRDDLRRSAADLSIADMPSDDEFPSLVRGTPVFDPGAHSARVARPKIALIFGKQYAERRLARRLFNELGESVYKALSIYSGVLKEWVRLVTSQLERRFETYAERYRAQAERSLGGARLTAEEVNVIEENLKTLRVPHPSGLVEATSKRVPQDESKETAREIARLAGKGETR
jgi:hypothetical protein